MKATINNDGSIVLFPQTQVELFAVKQLVSSCKPPTFICNSQMYMGEPDYRKLHERDTQTNNTGSGE